MEGFGKSPKRKRKSTKRKSSARKSSARKSTKRVSRGKKSPLARAARACKGKKAYKSCFKKMIKKFKKKK